VTSRPIDRREALGALAAALTTLGGCGGGPPIPKDALVVSLERVPAGSVVPIRWREEPLLVLNLGGTIRALSGTCTHEGCPLGWNPRQQLIRCPCHGSAFFPDGTVKSGPAQRPLRQYPAEVRKGKLIVFEGGTTS